MATVVPLTRLVRAALGVLTGADDSSRAWVIAAKDGHASFDLMFAALYQQYDGRWRIRRRAKSLYPRLLENLWAHYGPIERSFYANRIRAGVVLCHNDPSRLNGAHPLHPRVGETATIPERSSSDGRAAEGRGAEPDAPRRGAVRRLARLLVAGVRRLVGRPPPPPADEYHLFAIIWWDTVNFDADAARSLFGRIELLRTRIDKDLVGTPDHAVCVQFLYAIVTDLIASIHREHVAHATRVGSGASARHLAEIARLRERVDDAEQAYEAAAQRIAQEHYFRGAGSGALATFAVAAIAFAVLSLSGAEQAWATTAAAGCAGAILSVMRRTTQGGLALNYDAGWSALRRTGALRPATGALLGLASYVLVAGPLSPTIQASSGSTTRLLFFTGIAFAGGFSERLVQDMLAGTARLAGGSAGEEERDATRSGAWRPRERV